MEQILKVWTEIEKASYKKVQGRPGERNDEYLIGELELPYTKVQYYNDIQHYIISFNEKADVPLAKPLSSANAERLTDDEIIEIVNNPPPEEV